jgi:hypothetical protein
MTLHQKALPLIIQIVITITLTIQTTKLLLVEEVQKTISIVA